MTLVSVTAYAKLHGVSKTAAQKWQARGLLKFRDGRVDVEASDASLCHAGLGRFSDAATRDRQPPAKAGHQKVAGVAALADQLHGALDEEDMPPGLITFVNNLAAGTPVDLITAQTIKENGLALLRLIEARKKAGEVIEIAEAEAVIFEMFRLQRDAWLNFPARAGPLIAADMGVEPERVVEVLTAHVHKQLSDLGEVGHPLRQAGEAEANGQQGLEPATTT